MSPSSLYATGSGLLGFSSSSSSSSIMALDLPNPAPRGAEKAPPLMRGEEALLALGLGLVVALLCADVPAKLMPGVALKALKSLTMRRGPLGEARSGEAGATLTLGGELRRGCAYGVYGLYDDVTDRSRRYLSLSREPVTCAQRWCWRTHQANAGSCSPLTFLMYGLAVAKSGA